MSPLASVRILCVRKFASHTGHFCTGCWYSTACGYNVACVYPHTVEYMSFCSGACASPSSAVQGLRAHLQRGTRRVSTLASSACRRLTCATLFCARHCEVQYCEVQYCEVPYCEVQYCEVQYCEVPYCEVQYCEVQYCEVQVQVPRYAWVCILYALPRYCEL